MVVVKRSWRESFQGKGRKGGREYKREAEARERSEAPLTEEERPEQPTAPVAEDAPAADPAQQTLINLQELVCNLCEEEYAPEEFQRKADDPGDQAEDAPKDTGEVEDTAQQEQATGDPDELPDLVLDEPRIQPPQPPPAAAGAPTPGTPEKEKEKKGHKEAFREV